jgi:pantoate--beta-alanine ligase
MSALLISAIAELRERVAAARRAGGAVGCVPTMGSLHAGHGALVDRARAESTVVVVTIFVNPIQFDRKEDYDRYARSLPADLAFCDARGVDLVFAPSVEEMYPEPSGVFIEAPALSRHLCGQFRPGHFRGVATVVGKLFHIVEPDLAFFGEKDAQQLAIVERMVKDLNFPVRIVPVPTVREADGLALSSRNARLSAGERRVAPLLYQALLEGRRAIAQGERDARKIRSRALGALAAEPAMRVEYLEVVDRAMQPVAQVESGVRIAAAVWLGSTRLIDNVFCAPDGMNGKRDAEIRK